MTWKIYAKKKADYRASGYASVGTQCQHLLCAGSEAPLPFSVLQSNKQYHPTPDSQVRHQSIVFISLSLFLCKTTAHLSWRSYLLCDTNMFSTINKYNDGIRVRNKIWERSTYNSENSLYLCAWVQNTMLINVPEQTKCVWVIQSIQGNTFVLPNNTSTKQTKTWRSTKSLTCISISSEICKIVCK